MRIAVIGAGISGMAAAHVLCGEHELAVYEKRRGEISGTNRTSICGAYWGLGGHEDGANSALEVCKPFGKGL